MAKQHYCFLKKFNNYFNRKVIRYESLEDYQNASEDFFIPSMPNNSMMLFDFNPNDNVTTEIIVNEVPFDPDYFLLLDTDGEIVSRWFVLEQKRNRQGQWLYQLKRDVVSDFINTLNDAPIFVEKGMLQEGDPFIVNDEGMSLNQIKRDELPIVDKSKTAWIVGYMAKNAGGADINVQVDAENLKIDYETIGDIASAMGTTEGVLNSLINFEDDDSSKAYFTKSISMRIYLTAYDTGGYYTAETPFNYNFNYDFSDGTGSIGTGGPSGYGYLFITMLGQNATKLTEPFRQAVIDKKTLWQNQIASMLSKSYYLTQAQLNILWSYNGVYVKYNGKYYTLSIDERGSHTTSADNVRKDGTYSALDQTCSKTLELVGSAISPLTSPNYNPITDAGRLYKLSSNETEVIISLKLVADSDIIPQLNTTISSGRRVTSDQEYDIFAIPLSIRVSNNGTDFTTAETYARRMASAIAMVENAKVYDLQLLPYCPLPELLSGYNDNEIIIDNLTEHDEYDFIIKNISNTHTDYASKSDMTFTPNGADTWDVSLSITMSVPAGKTPTITDVTASVNFSIYGSISNLAYTVAGNVVSITFTYTGIDPTDASLEIYSHVDFVYPDDTNCGIVFYVQKATFETTISMNSLNPYWNSRYEYTSKKTVSNCFMFRIVSPNYQGAFQFDLAKNNNSIEYFNVLCTYKPYTPVIKVAPNFKWLYGMEFKDNRGLICGGDFSLPRITDEWRTYELNNKNYQNIFNRDIQHLEFMQKLEMRNQLVSGAVGILSDTAKGAGAGAFLGGGWGALAGGVIGGGASALGYGIDVDTLARTQRENKQLAIDKFNYTLGNVKALPYTLTKVGSFDVISKIFPFIETYSCSDEEMSAFEDKIKYESMTVMRIGTLSQFANFDSDLHYFKGMLIRNDEIADDTHVLNAIYEELLKGVYI